MRISFLKILKSQYWPAHIAIFLLVVMSLVTLFSIQRELFWRQLVFSVIGIGILFWITFINLRPFLHSTFWIYASYIGIIAFLVATLFIAHPIRGSRSWLTIGPIQFQTSELAKIALLLMLAKFWSRGHIFINRFSTLFLSFLFFVIPAALILRQPDLGTVVILFCLWLVFLLMSGIRLKYFAIVMLIFLIVFLFAWNFFLKDYQRARILGFLYPRSDVFGINYSITQAKIAIGSAGVFGKGFMRGTQSHLGFLPEAATDYVFAAFVEEWGFLGAFVWLVIWTFLIYHFVRLSRAIEDNMGMFIVLGAGALFFIQIAINLGAHFGYLPVIGISLPFFSYGGSNILTNFILVGIIQAVYVHRTIFREVRHIDI